jgi:hypothetical protein
MGRLSPALASFASPSDFRSYRSPSNHRAAFFSPAFPQFFHRHRTMTSSRVSWLSIGATITLSLWAGWMLAAETRDHLTRCKLGPEPAACELRLLGR